MFSLEEDRIRVVTHLYPQRPYYIDCTSGSAVLDEEQALQNYNMLVIRLILEDDETGEEKMIGYMKLHLINEIISNKRGQSFIDILDNADYSLINAFTKLSQQLYEEDIIKDNAHSGYMQTFYILPKYRKHGIGKLILENLGNILKNEYGITLRYLITLTEIETVEVEGLRVSVYQKDNPTDEDYAEQEETQRVLQDVGYITIGDNWYIHKYNEE